MNTPKFNKGDRVKHISGVKHLIVYVSINGNEISYFIDKSLPLFDNDSDFFQHGSPYFCDCEFDLRYDRKRKLENLKF